jgi:hypothetical protein
MKKTNLRAVYKGVVKNDSRKKKLLTLANDVSDTTLLKSGFMYDLEVDSTAKGQISVNVKTPSDLKIKYESVHDFLMAWSDINSF